MKLKIFLIAAALLMNTPCITHAADGKEKLQGKMVDVKIHNKTDYILKAHLKKHNCMYDVNKYRNIALPPGAMATVGAETKASGVCFLMDSFMIYEFTVAVPNKSPLLIGSCKIEKELFKSEYRWRCYKQEFGIFYIEATSSKSLLLIWQDR